MQNLYLSGENIKTIEKISFPIEAPSPTLPPKSPIKNLTPLPSLKTNKCIGIPEGLNLG